MGEGVGKSRNGSVAGSTATKADQTRARIVQEAARIGTIRGFGTVSLGDVAASAQLSKSAVFKYFGGEGALELAAVTAICASFADTVWLPSRALSPGRERLTAIFTRWLDWVDGEDNAGGCGIIQAQIEYDDQPGSIRTYLKRQQKMWTGTLMSEFRALATGCDAALAAFEFRSLVLGYNQSRRLIEDPASRKHAVTACGNLLDRLTSANA